MKGDKAINLYISLELLEKVEDYWHKKKLSNRNMALIELIEKGLQSQ